MTNEAILSSEKNYTIFRFNNHVISFKSPYSFEKYTEIKEWDAGYIVVMAKYLHNSEEEEAYIDLVPILRKLYYDVESFLKPIKKVRISYD